MIDRLAAIHRYQGKLAGAIPDARRCDPALGRRVELLVAEVAGALAGQPDDGRIYGLWVKLTMTLHELEEAQLVEPEPPVHRW